MSNKHTPGPWSVVEMDDTFIKSSTGYVIRIPNTGCYKSGDEFKANSHLIAAAPDLLEALEELVRQADTFGCEGLFWDMARAAIAKAKGVSP